MTDDKKNIVDNSVTDIDELLSTRAQVKTDESEDPERKAAEDDFVSVINDIINDPSSTQFLQSGNDLLDTHDFNDTVEFGDTREIPTLKSISKSRPEEESEAGGEKAKITSIRHYIQMALDSVDEEKKSSEPQRFVINIPEENAPEEKMYGEVTFDQLISDRNGDTIDSKEIGNMFRAKKLSDRVSKAVKEIITSGEDGANELDNEPDKAKARKSVEKKVTKEGAKQVVIGVLALILLGIGLFAPSEGENAHIYAWVSLAIYAVACVLGGSVFEKGIRAALKKRLDINLLATVFALITAVQGVVIAAAQSGGNTYFAFPVFVMFFARYVVIEKDKKTVADLKMMSFKPAKICAEVIDNDDLNEEIAGNGNGKVTHIRRTNTVPSGEFFTREYSKDGNEKIVAVLSICVLAAIFCVFFVSLFVQKSVLSALSSTVAAMALLVPAGMAVVGNLAYTSFSKKLRYGGAALIGTKAVDRVVSAGTLLLEDRHLFPVKSLKITGVKQYGYAEANRELMTGTVSVLKALKCPLSAVMYDMIDKRDDLLSDAEELKYRDGRGVSATVKGVKFVIGNVKMMTENGIALPQDSVAEKISANGKVPLYVAMNGTLSAIFAVKYEVNGAVKQRLHELMQYGVGFAVKTRDPNITPDFISKSYDIPFGYLRVLPDSVAVEEENSFRANTVPDIIAITKDPAAYLRAHIAAFKMQMAGRINKALLIAASSMGAAVTAIMLLTSVTIMPVSVLVVNLLWSLPILAVNIFLKRTV